ncbi:MAG TPA: hypothetical protein VEL69_05155 [Ktedonobacteraceae bacterium]|nr:hypothetical protein [Ktedonobacteraceae bacterium]
MHMFLASVASDPLSTLGQLAAIIILIYMLVYILIGLIIALVLLLGMTWVREKVELIKRIRPVVDSANTTVQSAIDGTLAPPREDENQIIRTAVEIPAYTRAIETNVEQSGNRVADTVIELRARTMMARGVLKAFFLPGLTQRPKSQLQIEGVGFGSPAYRIAVEERAAVEDAPIAGETASPSPGPNNATAD